LFSLFFASAKYTLYDYSIITIYAYNYYK